MTVTALYRTSPTASSTSPTPLACPNGLLSRRAPRGAAAEAVDRRIEGLAAEAVAHALATDRPAMADRSLHRGRISTKSNGSLRSNAGVLPQPTPARWRTVFFLDGGTTDVATICKTLGISRATLYRYLRPRTGE